MIPSLILGIAMSCFFLSMTTIVLDRIPPEKVPAAAGLSNFSRIIAGSFAASIVTTLWDRRETLHQSRLAEAVGQGYPVTAAIDGMGRMDMTQTQAAGAIARQLGGQAYLLASDDLFRLSALLSGGLVVLIWLVRRPAAPSGPVAAD